MTEDYLWDRSGPPDPEMEKLEQTLAPLRYGAAGRPSEVPPRPAPSRARWVVSALAAAAAVVAAVGLSQSRPSPPTTAWRVDSFAGQARLGGAAAALAMSLQAGQVVSTSGDSELTLRADELGTILIGPDSKLHAATNQRVTLESGVLHAFIWAPPRQFVVDTPSARAVDLGCQYTLRVDPSGDGVINVSMGWVAFQFGDHESFIPEGAECVTRKHGGPGIPYYQDAPPRLRESLAQLERGDEAALSVVLAAARPADALTLWHLLTRAAERDRGQVYDRFASLVSLPPEVTRAAVLRRNAHSLDLCWNALKLENTDWWRGWERRWDSR
jgi:FecR protein